MYCDFTTNDHVSDVHVLMVDVIYNIQIHSSRVRFTQPLPPPINQNANPVAWQARKNAVDQLALTMPRDQINGPHDADGFSSDSAPDCIAELLRLRALGYRVPQSAITLLTAEGDRNPSRDG